MYQTGRKNNMLLIAFFAWLGIACNDNTKAKDIKDLEQVTSRIKFDYVVYNFGKIKAGKKVKYSYTYKNIGKAPLIISDVYTSCGCTVPDFSKKPLLPGEKSSIDVVFDSENDSGYQQKAITVVSNSEPSTTEIYLTGEILSNKYY